MSEISHLATDKDIVSMWSEIINVIYLLIAGVVGGTCTFWWNRKKYLIDKQKLEHEIESSRAKIEADKKSLRQQMITNNIAPMRQAWINDVRNKTSDFLALHDSIDTMLSQYDDLDMFDNEESKKKELFTISVKTVSIYHNLSILLPMNEEHSINLQNDLKKLIDHISIKDKKLSDDEVDLHIDSVIQNTKLLLKKEWEVAKSLKEIE